MRSMLRRCAVVLLLAAAGVPITGPAESAPLTSQAVEATAPAPPMGWASWNSFAAKIDSKTIRAQADALVSSGMKAAGYSYVNIDEGWWQGGRDAQGNFVVDEAEWPGGMKAISDYLHSKGLKAGIYTDAGKDGCGYYYPTGRPAAPGSGSEGHYDQDMLQFQQWGFDYVKVDWCGGDAEGLDPATTYRAISDSIARATAKTGRPLKLSICNWGKKNPWNWGAGTGALWRTSNDIIFYGQSANFGQVLTNFDQAQHPVSQHTGYINDPDMLTVGMSGLTDAQARAEMSLWAVSGAPLLAGNNLATMSAATKSILTNREVIAVDQDSRGLQGVKVSEDGPGLQVYGKVLSGSGRRAVVLLNRTSASAAMSVRWADLGLRPDRAQVRDVWTGATSRSSNYTVTVPAGDAALLAVEGTDVGSETYEGSVTADFTGLAVADVTYTASAAQTATLKVNDQQPTTVAFPATGRKPGKLSVIVSLAKGTNKVSVTNAPSTVAISPLPGTAGAEVVGAQSGRCLDVDDNGISNGIPLQLWDCAGGPNQTWVSSRGQLVVNGGKCLDAYDGGTADGTAVVIWDCHGGTNQRWSVNADGTITNAVSGKCLDADDNGTGNRTKAVLWTCGSGADQRWSLR